MNSATYPTTADKGKFFKEEFQLINTEVMMKLGYHRFATPDEIMDEDNE